MKVSWTRGPNSAIDDLKDLPKDLALDLMCIAEEELKTPEAIDSSDPDEGSDARSNSPLMWRRGVTRAQRRQLLEAEAQVNDDADEEEDASWNYVLIYRVRTFKEILTAKSRGFVVLRVIHNRHLADELTRRMGDPMSRITSQPHEVGISFQADDS